MSAKGLLSRIALLRFPSRLSGLYGRSLYGALMLMALVGLGIPAAFGGYVLIGVQEQQATRRGLQDDLQRNADILALGVEESLWNMNVEAGRLLVDSLMRDPAVVHVRVRAQGNGDFIDRHARVEPAGNRLHTERDVVAHGQVIGRVLVEMDDSRSQHELRAKQWRYAMVLLGQLAVSLLLFVLLLQRRLVAPLRTLMGFSDDLSRGRFDTPLVLTARDELGRLGRQLEQMRIAIGELFEDIGRREERFRSIVTQVPGAVFRARPGGVIDFVSDAIEDICGYPARMFMNADVDRWSDLVLPEDRRQQRHLVRDALGAGRSYEIEYRIIDANGIERWVMESGQPIVVDGELAWVDGIVSDISERKYNEMRIEALLAEQGALLDNVMFGVVHVRERRIVSANRRFDELFGYPEGALVGDSIATLFPSIEAYEQGLARSAPLLVAGKDYSDEVQFRRRDGSLFWGMVSGRALDPEHPDAGSIWVYADATERRQAEEKLRLSATVLEHIADGVMVIDVNGMIVATNPACTRITGYTEAEAVGKHSSLTRGNGHSDEFYATLWRDLADTGFWRGEIQSVRKNGEAYVEWVTVSAVRHGDAQAAPGQAAQDEARQYVCVFSDITQIKESQDKLDHLAHHDPLTGLPNRLLFHDRLQHAMARASRCGHQLAVMFIDLDRFKNVNDTLGHHVGDELLKQVAASLAACLREGDTLARLGGDEFIVLLEDVDGERGARGVAEKLMRLFERPVLVSGYELFVTGSVGIALFPQDAQDLNMLIRNADVAMYQAKARGRNGYRFYAPSMDGEGVERLRLEALLRRAIERKEIWLAYQPQVEIGSGRLIGVEALVRWSSPELGQVSPVRFIPLAEDTGFIGQLGAWVLEEACRQMVRWEQAGLRVPKVAVNLSGRQFDRGSVAPLVRQALADTGLAPQRLQLEVTESVIMNTGDALQYINDLHRIGVELAIDDFGTGYSSLAYLKQLPVQALKIDRSFIADITGGVDSDANDEAIAIAIIQLGKSMNLAVVAEGVESQAQADFLLRHGCNRAQGYLYSKPLDAGQMLAQWGAQAQLPYGRLANG